MSSAIFKILSNGSDWMSTIATATNLGIVTEREFVSDAIDPTETGPLPSNWTVPFVYNSLIHTQTLSTHSWEFLTETSID